MYDCYHSANAYYFLLIGYTTLPPPHFQGIDCSHDVDECIPQSGKPGVCDDKINTMCRNLYGSYTCDCQPGYTGSGCEIITTTKSTMTDEQSVSPSSSSVSLSPSSVSPSSSDNSVVSCFSLITSPL